MFPFHRPGLCRLIEHPLHLRPHGLEDRRNAVILQIGRIIPMTVSEEDTWIFHIVEQFQVKATRKASDLWFPTNEKFLEACDLRRLERHFYDPYDHDRSINDSDRRIRSAPRRWYVLRTNAPRRHPNLPRPCSRRSPEVRLRRRKRHVHPSAHRCTFC